MEIVKSFSKGCNSKNKGTNMPNISLYTDGSSIPNPGEGGWGSVLIATLNGREYIKAISGYFPSETEVLEKDLHLFKGAKRVPTKKYDKYFIETTNNRMEVMSIIGGLSAIKKKSEASVTIYADSQWAINALNGKWNIKENLDLVLMGKELIKQFSSIDFVWVKGHNNNQYNEVANTIAMEAVQNKKGSATVLKG